MAPAASDDTPPPRESGDAGAARPRLRKNLAALYAGEGLAKALAIVTFGWLGRHLGKAAYGELELALSVFFVLNLVLEAGLGPYGAREAARRPETTPALVGRIVSVRVVLLGIALVGLVPFAFLARSEPASRALLLAYGLVLLPGPLALNFVFQARDRMELVALSTFLRQLGMFVGVVLLVRGPGDLLWVPASDLVAFTLVVALQHVLYRAAGGSLTFFPPGTAHVAREAAPLAGAAVVWAVRMFFPTLALGLLSTSAATGVYGAAHRLVVAAHAFCWLYFFNLLPSLSRAALESDRTRYRELLGRSATLVSWAIVPACLAGGVAAPVLLPAIYGQEFREAEPVFAIAVWMLAAAFLSGHHRYALIAFGHLRQQFFASLAGCLTAVFGCLALALFGRLDPLRAAVIFVASELVTLATAQLLLARLVEPLSALRHVWKPAAVSIGGWALGNTACPGSPLGRAALVLGAAALGFWATEPALVRRLVSRGGGRAAGR